MPSLRYWKRERSGCFGLRSLTFIIEADALDAVQKTVCRAFQNLKKVEAVRYFDTWIVRILLNACADEHRWNRKTAYTGKETTGLRFRGYERHEGQP